MENDYPEGLSEALKPAFDNILTMLTNHPSSDEYQTAFNALCKFSENSDTISAEDHSEYISMLLGAMATLLD